MNPISVVWLRDRPVVSGLVVVIDVIRAFTSAAAAFAAGAERILCVETLEHAFAARQRHPGAVLMGEEGGLRPAGFDLGISPIEVSAADLRGALVIQRTSNGTRGLVGSLAADLVMAAAATNISATAHWIARHQPTAAVTALCTGDTPEDEACARHLGAILRGAPVDRPAPVDGLAAAVQAAGKEHVEQMHDPAPGRRASFAADVRACSEVDRYDFAMIGRQLDATVELHAEAAAS